jgi:membrane peptidoglycan carboxypeptidase
MPNSILIQSKKKTEYSKTRVIHKKNKQKKYIPIIRKRKKKNGNNNLFYKAFTICVGLFFFVFLGFLIISGVYFQKLERSLPDPDKLIDRKSEQTTIITDRNGEELYKIYADQNRKFVKLEELPEHFKWAVLSAEDINFYEHEGLDLEAIIKSLYINVVAGEIVRGASTITQQLVRNTILYDLLGEQAYEETYSRKIQEILITVQVEQTFSKDEILQMYLNEVAFGGVNYGVQAASIAYFDKDAKDLTLAESAVLAGTIASPTNYSPLFSPSLELPVRRQHAILNSMLINKDLTGVTEEEIEAAKKEKIRYAPLGAEIRAPHFVFYIRRELEDMYDISIVEREGLRVKTTLDLTTQQVAQKNVTQGIAEYGHKWNIRNGGMIVIDPHTGEILAMVGSVNYWETENPQIQGNFNVTISKNQMGSSVKPYTYLAAFERGFKPTSIVPDKSIDFEGYKVENWDDKYYGEMTIRQALAQSRNVPAVYTLQQIGVSSFLDTARRLGIKSLDEQPYHGLSVTLGASETTLLENTVAYTVFANEGILKPTVSILEVKDSDGNILYEHEEQKGKRVFDKKHIQSINWILCDIEGFGDRLMNHMYLINGHRVLCGKTGTSDGPRALSAILYHKNLVVGVWAGNNNNIATPGAWSTTVPLPIANSFIKEVSNMYTPEGF